MGKSSLLNLTANDYAIELNLEKIILKYSFWIEDQSKISTRISTRMSLNSVVPPQNYLFDFDYIEIKSMQLTFI